MRLIDNNIMFLSPELMARGKDETAPQCQLPENVALFATARNGLSYIARSLKETARRVLIPAYTCATVWLPFTQEGYLCGFYAVDKNLRINEENFLGLLEHFRPDVVVVHPYYGMDLTEKEQALLRKAKEQGCFVVEDLTHSLFSPYRYDFVDAYVGSMRKYFDAPDGGFYESKVLPAPNMEELEEKKDFVKLMTDQLYLRDQWLKTGDKQLRLIAGHLDGLATKANRADWTPCRISDFSRRVLVGQDPKANSERRKANARYLYEKLKNSDKVDMVYSDISDISSGPLWFPLYAKRERKQWCKEVFSPNGVAAIRLWPVEDPATVINDDVRYIYDNILVFPCGQMYDEEDMQYLVDLIEGN